jgi:putative endonuclease
MIMRYYTYILRCVDDTFYVGATNDVSRRLQQHNNSKQGAHYTKIRRPVVYVEEFDSLGESRKREAEIKRMTRVKKEQLLSVE